MPVVKPTARDVLDKLLESIYQELDDSWRHGNYVYEVFHRDIDDTYWATNYEKSGDGEYNTLRDDPNQVEFTQVMPVTVVKTITEYKPYE